MAKTYYTKVYGCQMNYADAERIDFIMQESGFTKSLTHQNADIVIVISCSVREKAEQKVYSWVNQLSNDKIIILTGCMVRRDFKDSEHKNTDQNLKKIKRICPNIRYFIPIKDIKSIATTIKNSIGELEQGSSKISENYLTTPQVFSKDSITAYIPIMTGCAQFCTYCIVPFARGEEISRETKDIIYDVKSALELGKTHIVLLGQIVNKWIDPISKLSFVGLLKEICSINQDFWLTFLSPHPNYVTNELLDFIVYEPKMLKYLGLPLQHGDNGILKQMNRGYNVEKFINQIKYLQATYQKSEMSEIIPLYLTTDIIVGFGDENEESFLKTYQLLKEIQFNQVFVAYYSERPYTPASISIPDKVAINTKIERKNKIRTLTEKIYACKNKKLVGKIVPCRSHDNHRGITYSNQYVELDQIPQELVGKLISIKITYGGRYGIKGKLVFV